MRKSSIGCLEAQDGVQQLDARGPAVRSKQLLSYMPTGYFTLVTFRLHLSIVPVDMYSVPLTCMIMPPSISSVQQS